MLVECVPQIWEFRHILELLRILRLVDDVLQHVVRAVDFGFDEFLVNLGVLVVTFIGILLVFHVVERLTVLLSCEGAHLLIN